MLVGRKEQERNGTEQVCVANVYNENTLFKI